MANLKEIRNRITSISSTMQITSAMKMVSAAKLKKAQDAITMLRPYSEKLTDLISNVAPNLEPEEMGPYSQQRPVKNVLYIVVTSNRGLAGAFNSSVIKESRKQIQDQNASVQVLTVGKKAFDAFKNTQTVFENQSDIYDRLTFTKVSRFVDDVMKAYREEQFDQVFVIYNKFVNAATQEVTTEQVLPISMPKDETIGTMDYIFEPSSQEIMNNLIPKSVKTQVYKAILDSVASEHGARMTAMHKATDNAQELKNELVINYNKARQASITGEILEIVSGAEALKN